ncbi:MAG TPA: DHA2 family efflux MFS transporter permease subunit [Dehalococcoidia bacterium]
MMSKTRLSYPALVLTIMSAGTFLAFLDATVVTIAFPDIVKSFPAAGIGNLSWILNGYTIAFSAMLVPFGRVADLVGRRRFFIAGLFVFTTASLVCALTPTPEPLIAARVVQGLGAAAMIPSALALILGCFPAEKRPRAIGLYGVSASVAAAAGPALGGLIVSVASWRWVFTINVPLGILAAVLATSVVKETKDPQGGKLPDLAGAGLFAASIAMLAFAIVRAPAWGWTSPRVLLLTAGSALVLAAFLLRTARHPVPTFEIGMWRVRSFSVANAAGLLFSMGFFSMLVVNPLFLTGVWHYSILKAGLAIAPAALAAGLGAPFGGWLSEKRGPLAVAVPGSLLFAASRLWLALATTSAPDFLALWLPTTLLTGFGTGMAFSSLSSAAISDLPPGRFATGSALNQTSRQVGAVLGVAIVIAILGSSGVSQLTLFRYGYEFSAALALAGAVVAFGLRTRPAAAGSRDAAAVASQAPVEPEAVAGYELEPEVVMPAGPVAGIATGRGRKVFTYQSEVFFDDLDAMAMLHNARYAVHLERAVAALYGTIGKQWLVDPAQNPDQFHVVREALVEYLKPFRGVGAVFVDLWVVRLGTTSCQYGFRFRNRDDSETYATGKRLVIKLDPQTLRPSPWTDVFLRLHEPLVGPTLFSGAPRTAPGPSRLLLDGTRRAGEALHSTVEAGVDGSSPGEG